MCKSKLCSVIDHSYTIPPEADESKNQRIINGDKADVFDWPWQVALRYQYDGYQASLKMKIVHDDNLTVLRVFSLQAHLVALKCKKIQIGAQVCELKAGSIFTAFCHQKSI